MKSFLFCLVLVIGVSCNGGGNDGELGSPKAGIERSNSMPTQGKPGTSTPDRGGRSLRRSLTMHRGEFLKDLEKDSCSTEYSYAKSNRGKADKPADAFCNQLLESYKGLLSTDQTRCMNAAAAKCRRVGFTKAWKCTVENTSTSPKRNGVASIVAMTECSKSVMSPFKNMRSSRYSSDDEGSPASPSRIPVSGTTSPRSPRRSGRRSPGGGTPGRSPGRSSPRRGSNSPK